MICTAISRLHFFVQILRIIAHFNHNMQTQNVAYTSISVGSVSIAPKKKLLSLLECADADDDWSKSI